MIRMLNEEELILKKALNNIPVPREPCLPFVKPISVKITLFIYLFTEGKVKKKSILVVRIHLLD